MKDIESRTGRQSRTWELVDQLTAKISASLSSSWYLRRNLRLRQAGRNSVKSVVQLRREVKPFLECLGNWILDTFDLRFCDAIHH